MSGYHDYKICPQCGRKLDPLEACSCASMTPPPAEKVAEPFTPPFRFEARGTRYGRVVDYKGAVVSPWASKARAMWIRDALNQFAIDRLTKILAPHRTCSHGAPI